MNPFLFLHVGKARNLSTACWWFSQLDQVLNYNTQAQPPAGTPNLLPVYTTSISSNPVKHCADSLTTTTTHTRAHARMHAHTHAQSTRRKQDYRDLNYFTALTQPAKQPLLSTKGTLALGSHVTSKDGPNHHSSSWNRLHPDTTPFSDITPLLFSGGYAIPEVIFKCFVCLLNIYIDFKWLPKIFHFSLKSLNILMNFWL